MNKSGGLFFNKNEFYEVTLTVEIHVTFSREIQITYVYDVISL